MTGVKNYGGISSADAITLCARALEHIDTMVQPEEIRPAVRLLLREAIEMLSRYGSPWGLPLNHRLSIAEGILDAVERGRREGG